MIYLLTLILSLGVVYFALMFITFLVMGWYANSVEQAEYLDILADPEMWWGNSLNEDMICTRNSEYGFIARVPVPLLGFKYYIHDVGVVPRWSKLHKEIEKITG